jgi:hypothetical protein
LRLFAGESREPSKQFGLVMVRNMKISMKHAKELMLEYTAFSFREPKKTAEMFAEDGAFELPYLATFGLPTEYKDRDAIAGFFPIRARHLSRFPIREYQGADRYSRPSLCRILGHCGIKQNRTSRSSTLLFAAGCREWKDQVV